MTTEVDSKNQESSGKTIGYFLLNSTYVLTKRIIETI